MAPQIACRTGETNKSGGIIIDEQHSSLKGMPLAVAVDFSNVTSF
jgi:hypothetical protein